MEWIVNSAKINRISYMLPLYSKQWKTWWTMNRKNTKENRTKDHSSRMRNGFRDFRILGDRITFIPSIVSKAKNDPILPSFQIEKVFKSKKQCRINITKFKKQKRCHLTISKFPNKICCCISYTIWIKVGRSHERGLMLWDKSVREELKKKKERSRMKKIKINLVGSVSIKSAQFLTLFNLWYCRSKFLFKNWTAMK